MKTTPRQQNCDDGQEGSLLMERAAGRRSRGFGHLKMLVGILAPLALILLSPPQPRESNVVGGRMSMTGTVQPTTSGVTDAGSTGTASSSTSSTSSTGTTGTTGTSSGDVADGGGAGIGHLSRIDEIRAAESKKAQAGQVATLTNRHVVRMKMLFGRLVETLPNGDVRHSGCSSFGADPTGEMGPLINSSGSIFVATNSVEYPSGWLVQYGPTGEAPWEAYLQIGSNGILPGQQLMVQSRLYNWSERYNQATGKWEVLPGGTTSTLTATLSIAKIGCTSVSIDTRKAYGQPNTEGVLPGDANADLSNVRFSPWIYKGGHFVGAMAGSGDLSGTSRTQIQVASTSYSGAYVGSCVTAFTMGKPKGTTGATTVGIYRPISTDPNLGQGLNALWSTRWMSIDPQPQPDNPVNYSRWPFQYLTLSGTSSGEYVNWQIPYAYPTEQAEVWPSVCLSLMQDAGPTWQYFSSSWYEQTPNAQFPITDSRIRIWRVGRVN